MGATSTETVVAWVTWLLFLASGLAALAGLLTLGGARRMRYFQVRRAAVLRGWGRLLTSVILLVVAMLAMGFGAPVMRLALSDATAPGLGPTAQASLIAPMFTEAATLPSATLDPTATSTNSPGPPPTLTNSPTPTLSPTPALPSAYITPILTATVTPPAQATAANVRFSLKNDCTVTDSQGFFDQLPKQIFAHFYYDSWLPGVQWSGVWLRDGTIIYVETHLWDGSTGGCGYSNYDYRKSWWDEGAYEVQIFVGDRWLVSNRFQVLHSSPTPTASPSRTPRAPTATLPATMEPTLNRTPTQPDASPSASPTRGPSPTRTGTPSRTPQPPTATPSLTGIPTATIYPPGVTALATIQLPSGITTGVLRESPPDGQVVAFVQTGMAVEVLTGYQMIQGVVWLQVRLANGVEGWIPNFLLVITPPA